MTIKSMSVQLVFEADTFEERDEILERIKEHAERVGNEVSVYPAAFGPVARIDWLANEEFLDDMLVMLFDKPIETLRGEKDEADQNNILWDRLVD